MNEENQNLDEYIQRRYSETISYYWRASRNNKTWYKATRFLTVILGALVTLIASLASSKYFEGSSIQMFFTLGTPILAAFLTIIAGFSQSFQWGSTWQNMVLTAQQLQREYDKYLVTPENERDYMAEAEKLNSFVINESEGFFEHTLGGVKPKEISNDVSAITKIANRAYLTSGEDRTGSTGPKAQ